MAFKQWQIGLHIRQEEVVAIALVGNKTRRALRRWWRIPLEYDVCSDGVIRQPEKLAAALGPWRRELPRQHSVRLAFPSARTLQKSLTRPAMSLRESEQARWISSVIERELGLEPDALRFDYHEDTLRGAYHVTAAQSKDLSILLTLAGELELQVAAITPDASALQCFLPGLADSVQCVVWRDSRQWLWARRNQWGRSAFGEANTPEQLATLLALDVEALGLCGTHGCDPWRVVEQGQPLPPQRVDFTIALGLALGGAQPWGR